MNANTCMALDGERDEKRIKVKLGSRIVELLRAERVRSLEQARAAGVRRSGPARAGRNVGRLPAWRPVWVYLR